MLPMFPIPLPSPPPMPPSCASPCPASVQVNTQLTSHFLHSRNSQQEMVMKATIRYSFIIMHVLYLCV